VIPERIPERDGGLSAGSPHNLQWPEAVAITTSLAVAALLASGWADPMLPWAN
jgi:hypothetical protein